MVRYPLGGMLSWALQYVLGLHRLGHEVFIVEKAHYEGACFDPVRGVMTDDGSPGMRIVRELLGRFGLEDRLCFVDYHGTAHGISAARLDELFRTADVFIDGGTHGSWLGEAEACGRTVLIDGEPGFTQMKWAALSDAGQSLPHYDHHYSNGLLLGSEECSAPTAGRVWRPVVNPVAVDLFTMPAADEGAPFTTVMNWQSHSEIEYDGRRYGQKDIEFAKFVELPRRTSADLEVAVAGKCPRDELERNGWRLRSAHAVTESFDSYRRYIADSAGEFSVCKNVFVATRTGWFSDRSAAYLAAGRPVVLQDTGFSEVLPTGCGLFGVASASEAAAAIDEIRRDPRRHGAGAVEIAREYLDATRVMGRLLSEVGV
jgi:hypothetical protein